MLLAVTEIRSLYSVTLLVPPALSITSSRPERTFSFNGKSKIAISSAMIMTRNLSRGCIPQKDLSNYQNFLDKDKKLHPL
jgi:hypothetical protein